MKHHENFININIKTQHDANVVVEYAMLLAYSICVVRTVNLMLLCI